MTDTPRIIVNITLVCHENRVVYQMKTVFRTIQYIYFFKKLINSSLNTIVEGIESPLFSRTCRTKKSECIFNDNNLPWFVDDCRIKRQEFYYCLNLNREDRTDLNRINMITAHAIFKSALRKARFLFDSEQTKKLNDLRYKNAKEYWKLLRNASYLAQPNTWAVRKVHGIWS